MKPDSDKTGAAGGPAAVTKKAVSGGAGRALFLTGQNAAEGASARAAQAPSGPTRWAQSGGFALALALGLGLVLAACAPGGQTSDGSGAESGRAVPPEPKRVVSMSLMTDELVTGLLGADQILSLSALVDDPVLNPLDPQWLTAVPGRTPQNLEALAALQPDLVLASDWIDAQALAGLRALGLRVEVLTTPATPEGILALIRQVGGLLNRVEAAERWVAALEARRVQLAERLGDSLGGLSPAAGGQADPRLSAVEFNAWGSTGGPATSWGALLREAGLRNAVEGQTFDDWGFAQLSPEALLALDPDLLVVVDPAFASAGPDDPRARLLTDPLLSRLKAVRTGRLVTIHEGRRSSTGPAWFEAAWDLARAAYPERF